VKEVIVNVHHHAKTIIGVFENRKIISDYKSQSREDDLLLDTGGGLKKSCLFFLENNSPIPSFSTTWMSLAQLEPPANGESAQRKNTFATLATQERNSSRQLLFDDKRLLCGRWKGNRLRQRNRAPVNNTAAARLFRYPRHLAPPSELITEEGAFSIIDTYLRLAGARRKNSAFRADEYYWRDFAARKTSSKRAGMQRGIAP